MPIATGEAAPISTGALLPPGADAVVAIEDCVVDGSRVTVGGSVRPLQFVRNKGSDLEAGEVLLHRGVTINAAAIALLAAQGRASVRVACRPRVAVLSMGRELKPPGSALAPGDLYDANGPALAAMCVEAGAEAVLVPIVADDEAALAAALIKLDADLIVTSGGASVGEHDHLRGAIERTGGEILLWRVAMKPGKPLVLARVGQRPLLGLPGNPVSAMVSFALFGRPLVRRCLGCEPADDSVRVAVVLDTPLSTKSDRRTFLRARVRADGATLRAELATRQGSAALVSLRGANALVEVPAGEHDYEAGASVFALMFDTLLSR